MGLNKRLISQEAAAAAVVNTDNFDVVTYTGNGSTQTISSLNFAPDLVWIKERSGAYGAYPHILVDTVRTFGTYPNTNTLSTNENTIEEAYDVNANIQQASNGFELGSTSFYSNFTNEDTLPFVAWTWKGGGSAVSNTDGSITSSVSANQDAGFSIVRWTSDGSTGLEVGHGLGQEPDLLIYKRYSGSTSNWVVYTTAVDGSWDYVRLNTTDTKLDSTYTIADSSLIRNTSTAGGWVAYCFANVDGYQKISTYTIGSGSTQTITTGFQPRFVLLKSLDYAANWFLYDSERGDNRLFPNTDAAESSSVNYDITLNSDGFSITGAGILSNGTSYLNDVILYWAIA